MKKFGRGYGQDGALVSIVAIVFLAAALVGVLAFAIYANNGRQDYKNNSDKKSDAAVALALTEQKAKLENQFNEQAKQPILTYSGPATFGSVKFNYPKTWNGYIDTSNSGSPIKAFFYPGPVPANGVFYSLRVDLVSDDYTQIINAFNDEIKRGIVTATPYVPPQMAGQPNVQTGMRFDGQIEQENKAQGSMVVVKVRDKTLKIYSESPSYLSDFNNYVLANLTYVP